MVSRLNCESAPITEATNGRDRPLPRRNPPGASAAGIVTVLAMLLVVLPISGVPASPAKALEPGLGTDRAQESKVRLIEGFGEKDHYNLGIAVSLEPGWKTYWRAPGAAGIPPEFDWSRSENLADAEVMWPAPARIADPYGDLIGYVGEVVFPVRIIPVSPAAPTTVRLVLHYAVCNEICIPRTAEVTAMASGIPSSPADLGRLVSFTNQVPRPAREGDGLDVLEARFLRSGKDTVLDIVLDADDANAPVEIFAEYGNLFFGAPEPVEIGRGRQIHRLPVNIKETASIPSGLELVLTIVQGEKSLEYSVILDD